MASLLLFFFTFVIWGSHHYGSYMRHALQRATTKSTLYTLVAFPFFYLFL